MSRVRPNLASPDRVDKADSHAVLVGERTSALSTLRALDHCRLRKRELGVVAPLAIHSRCYGLKVIGANAARVAAKMIKPQTLRDRPYLLLVHGAMRQHLPAENSDRGIAGLVDTRAWRELDDPARRLVTEVGYDVVAAGDGCASGSPYMATRKDSRVTASTLTKGYSFHRRLPLRGGQGASGLRIRVAPFYILKREARPEKEGKNSQWQFALTV